MPMSSATAFITRSDGEVPGVGGDAEHPPGLVVVRGELVLPVGDVRPLRVGVDAGRRLVERVRVAERPAADAGAGEDEDVAQRE